MFISGIPVLEYINYLHHMVKQNGIYMPDMFILSIDSHRYQNTQNQIVWFRLKIHDLISSSQPLRVQNTPCTKSIIFYYLHNFSFFFIIPWYYVTVCRRLC